MTTKNNNINRLHTLTMCLVFAVFTASGNAIASGAGLLTGGAQDLEPLTLSVVEPLAKAPYELESGGYYEIEIICDGSGELALSGAEFFRNIWIDEVVINDIEIRPLGIASMEFDDEGTASISFIAIRPGTYELKIPGTKGESQRAIFTIK
ncbi:MAG: hypothetical protein KTR33_06360 [Gammaproteobacteria bacterium]|nr:hypothetical protein [Gammaproteobacteria bacterium]